MMSCFKLCLLLCISIATLLGPVTADATVGFVIKHNYRGPGCTTKVKDEYFAVNYCNTRVGNVIYKYTFDNDPAGPVQSRYYDSSACSNSPSPATFYVGACINGTDGNSYSHEYSNATFPQPANVDSATTVTYFESTSSCKTAVAYLAQTFPQCMLNTYTKNGVTYNSQYTTCTSSESVYYSYTDTDCKTGVLTERATLLNACNTADGSIQSCGTPAALYPTPTPSPSTTGNGGASTGNGGASTGTSPGTTGSNPTGTVLSGTTGHSSGANIITLSIALLLVISLIYLL